MNSIDVSDHTPTPWVKDGKWGQLEGSNGEQVIVYGLGLASAGTPDDKYQANAAFIVKAVNSHDELVNALTACRAVLVLLKDMHKGNAAQDAYRLADEVLTEVAK